MAAVTVGEGRFEQSLQFHVIRDIFLLVAVAGVELGIRDAALRYDFDEREPAHVEQAAQLASMELGFNMDVKGLHQGLHPRWPVGAHQQASATLKAEQFCLGCQVKTTVGDVLGTVQVRTVSSLAKGVMDLSPRASVKSDDEFGELAQDLNHFPDRITLIVQLVAARESGAFRVLAQTLDGLAASGGVGAAASATLRAQVAQLQGSFAAVSEALRAMAPPMAVAEAQSAEYQAFAQSLREMAVLEATMQKVAESGQQVLQRSSQRGLDGTALRR
jgi:methyl-accepting chemotaxis protein